MILFSLRLAVSDGGRSIMLYLYNGIASLERAVFSQSSDPRKTRITVTFSFKASVSTIRWFQKTLLNFQQIVGVEECFLYYQMTAKTLFLVQFRHNSV